MYRHYNIERVLGFTIPEGHSSILDEALLCATYELLVSPKGKHGVHMVDRLSQILSQRKISSIQQLKDALSNKEFEDVKGMGPKSIKLARRVSFIADEILRFQWHMKRIMNLIDSDS